jgi:hypothetical protein
VKRVLVALGAHRDTRIRMRSCMSPDKIERMPYIEIQLKSAVEATPEELAELEKSRSTRELAARVRGDSKQAELAAVQFPAHWRAVTLSRAKLSLDASDCELVDQLIEQVLPKLAVKVARDDLRCPPHYPSAAMPNVVVEALLPLPQPDERVEERH